MQQEYKSVIQPYEPFPLPSHATQPALQTGDLIWETPGAVYSLALVDGVVWAGTDQKIHIWSVVKILRTQELNITLTATQDGQKEGDIDIGVNVPVFSLLYITTTGTVWAACLDNCIRVFDPQVRQNQSRIL